MVKRLFRLDSSESSVRLDKLCSKGQLFYEGYVDDPRNTDNAWIEAVIYAYHDNEGNLLGSLEFKASNWFNVEGCG